MDFTGFADAVNSIGCVYVDVDHHYYHSNVGLAPIEQYAEIDIPAGYQRMCGYNALQYVRYRHDDNDLVRSARQQEFLREMRQELPAGQIASDYDKLKSILQKYVTLDIQNTRRPALAGAADRGRQRRPGGPGPLPGPARRPDGVLRDRVRLGDQGGGREVRGADAHDRPGTSTTTSSSQAGRRADRDRAAEADRVRRVLERPLPRRRRSIDDLTTSGQENAAKLANTKAKDGKPMMNFPIYYPTKLIPDSQILGPDSTPGQSRAFPIDGPGNEVYHGYKFVVSGPDRRLHRLLRDVRHGLA